jgi:hypothetical protein
MAIMSPDLELGVLTYDASRLHRGHLENAGVGSAAMDRIHIIGAPAGGHLHRLVREKVVYDHTRIEAELVEVAKELLRQHPRVSVLILECTQMPPFAEAIQRCLGNKVQVYDVCSMVNWFYGALVRRVPPSWRV